MKRFLSLGIVSISLAAGAANTLAQSRPVPPAPPPAPDVRAEAPERPGPIVRERVRAAREKEAARASEAAQPRREMAVRRVERVRRAEGAAAPSGDAIAQLERRIERLSNRLNEIERSNTVKERRVDRPQRDDRARRFMDRSEGAPKQGHKARGKDARGPRAHAGPNRAQVIRFWLRHHAQQERFERAPEHRGSFFGGAMQRPGFRAQMGPTNRPGFQRDGAQGFRFGGPGAERFSEPRGFGGQRFEQKAPGERRDQRESKGEHRGQGRRHSPRTAN